MTLAMTDEMKNCNPKSLKNGRGKPNAIATTNDNGECNSDHHEHKRRHWDGTAFVTVRRDSYHHRCTSAGKSTRHKKQYPNSQSDGFPTYNENHTKLAELQILKPEGTKQIQPIDAAALKLLQDPDDTHMYMNVSRPAPGRDFSCCGGIPKFARGRGHGRATQC